MLKEANKEVPDILCLNVSNRCNMQQPKLRHHIDALPPHVRALVTAACRSSEPPLAVPLPHASLISNLERAKKPVPKVRRYQELVLCCAFVATAGHSALEHDTMHVLSVRRQLSFCRCPSGNWTGRKAASTML